MGHFIQLLQISLDYCLLINHLMLLINFQGAGAVRRLSTHVSAGPPISVSAVVPNRYMPVTRISTHPAGSSSVYQSKRPLSSNYACDLQLIRKFPRSTDKSKGLRHFSTKVCEKVKEKGHTNYNEACATAVSFLFSLNFNLYEYIKFSKR